MNNVNIIGRLTKDPEVRFIPTTGTATTSITVAVSDYNSKTGEKIAYFIPVVIWGKRAEALVEKKRKGDEIGITGKLITRKYEKKDGGVAYITEVVANDVNYLRSVNNNDPFKDVDGDSPF